MGTCDVVRRLDVTGFINSNRYVSAVLAMVSENTHTMKVYDQLLRSTAYNFHIMAIRDYRPMVSISPEINFWEVACIVRSETSDIVVGWLGDDGPVFNPPNKSE